MSTKSNPVKPMPDFKHRIEVNIDDELDLTDTISMMALRAKGVLDLVVINLDSDTKANEAAMQAAILAAIAEIEDINATVQAYHRATVAAKNQTAGGAQ